MFDRRTTLKGLLLLVFLHIAQHILLSSVQAEETESELFPLKAPVEFGRGLMVASQKPVLFNERSFSIKFYGDANHLLFERTINRTDQQQLQTLVHVLNTEKHPRIATGIDKLRICDFQTAQAIFIDVAEKYPDDSVAQANSAAIRHIVGDDLGAIKASNAAIFVNSTNPFGFANRAAAHYYLGNRESAITDLEECIELLSSNQNYQLWRISDYLSKLLKQKLTTE